MFLGLPTLSLSNILENLESLHNHLQSLGQSAKVIITGGPAVFYCLSDYGFAEFFQAATNSQLRI